MTILVSFGAKTDYTVLIVDKSNIKFINFTYDLEP